MPTSNTYWSATTDKHGHRRNVLCCHMEFGIFSRCTSPRVRPSTSASCARSGFHCRRRCRLQVQLGPRAPLPRGLSHQPAPEIFLSWVAAKTKRIHVGHAIVNITAAVNHPIRVAERIKQGYDGSPLRGPRRVRYRSRLRRLRNGRGSSIPSAEETKPRWRESLEQIPRMLGVTEPYSFDGTYFRTPERNVLPKPYTEPHPPMWVACSSPSFTEAGELGLGGLCFTFGTPEQIKENIRAYQRRRQQVHRPGFRRLRQRQHRGDHQHALLRGRRSRPRPLLQGQDREVHPGVLQVVEARSRARGMPKTGPIPDMPAPTPESLKEGLKYGGRQIGDPDEVSAVIQMYEDIGVDQLIYAPLTLAMDQKDVLKSIEVFGKHVLPRFDKDPVHSTKRRREAQLQEGRLRTLCRRGARGASADAPRPGSIPRQSKFATSMAVVFDKVLIDGQWVPAETGTYTIVNPATRARRASAAGLGCDRRKRPRVRPVTPCATGRGRVCPVRSAPICSPKRPTAFARRWGISST